MIYKLTKLYQNKADETHKCQDLETKCAYDTEAD